MPASFRQGPRRPQKFFVPATSAVGPDLSVTGTGGVTFQVEALDATGLETFAGSAAETFAHPLLAATGAERFTGTAAETFAHPALAATGSEQFIGTDSETFAHPALAGTGTNILAITGTGAVAFQVPAISGGEAPLVEIASGQIPFVDYRRIPIKRPQPQKLERPVFVEPELPTPVRNDQEALVALYAAGAIDEQELAALLAA